MKALHGFSYPVFAVGVVGRCALVVAGGGGAVRTGVPNRLDVVHLTQENGDVSAPHTRSDDSFIAAKIGGGVDTGSEAIMNLTVANSGNGSFVFSLEGRECVEYLVRANHVMGDSREALLVSPHQQPAKQSDNTFTDTTVRKRRGVPTAPAEELSNNKVTEVVQHCHSDEWELTKLRSFQIPVTSSDMSVTCAQSTKDADNKAVLPTCICNGGSGGSLLAVGSDVGSVFLINRQVPADSDGRSRSSCDLKPFITYPDVSDGCAVGVYNISLTSPPSPQANDSSNSSPLLATICYSPAWSTLRVWRADCVSRDATSRSSSTADLEDKNLSATHTCRSVQPYAVACYSTSPSNTNPPASTDGQQPPHPGDGLVYGFKHCQFLCGTFTIHSNQGARVTQAKSSHILVTTLQAPRARRNDVGRLVLWTVPTLSKAHESTPQDQPIVLRCLSEIILPRGHLPACLTVHPNRHRGLIGVGTMEGQVNVYCYSPPQRRLTCVYSVNKAHPTFVTALTFLPPHPWSSETFSTGSDKRIVPTDLSYELASVSINRTLCWHRGPTFLRVSRISRGLHDSDGSAILGRYVMPVLRVLTCLLVVFLVPIYVALMDVILGWFVV